MTRFLWQLRQLGRRLGMAGLAGLVFLLAAGLLEFFWLRPEAAGLATDQARLARLQHGPKNVRALVAPAAASTPVLPTRSALPRLLSTLTQLAKEQGVDLPQGQFSLGRLSDSRLLRLQVNYPVKASYPALRALSCAELGANAFPGARWLRVQAPRHRRDRCGGGTALEPLSCRRAHETAAAPYSAFCDPGRRCGLVAETNMAQPSATGRSDRARPGQGGSANRRATIFHASRRALGYGHAGGPIPTTNLGGATPTFASASPTTAPSATAGAALAVQVFGTLGRRTAGPRIICKKTVNSSVRRKGRYWTGSGG